MHFLPFIEAKREGRSLTPAQIADVVAAYTHRAIPDYQMAAFLMAVFFRGLDATETRALTLAMRDSGDILRFPEDARPLVDKHSTGGVGDKVSLPLAPLLACLGLRVPMISGRGLGITGGTLDKLESIPGFTTALPAERIVAQVQELGCAMAGQTDRMVPADKALYALRDVTGTVPSLPLITASILSKKLAESLHALVLDVKFGTAAFMQNRDQARALAQAMVQLGSECGVNTRALLTDMNTPLGRAAGNWLEVVESVACLEGRGPRDLGELVLDCAAHLLVQTRRAASLDAARAQAHTCLRSGAPRQKWNELLVAQGADLTAFERKLQAGNTARCVREVSSSRSGFVSACDARTLGEVVRDLGGGRLTKDTVIDPAVGLDELVQPGEPIRAGAPLARVHASTAAAADEAVTRVRAAFVIADEPPAPSPRVVEEITGA